MKKAFTLIELLIVIVIIGILATALIPRVTGIQNKARYTRVEKDFRDLRAAVFLAQTNTNKPLKDITGAGCTDCACRGLGVSLKTLPSNHVCRTQWISALRKIEAAAGFSAGTLNLETDPRGSPYMLDENEGDGGCGDNDTLYSPGPDGDIAGMVRRDTTQATGDNKGINIAPMGCPGSY